ncbi:MAG: hypothetical protein KJ066_16970 [Acidobacteria bacterium]|nr:hypothetical protein [Acidobacteriota bacterium]
MTTARRGAGWRLAAGGWRPAWREERGQTTALAFGMLMTLVLFVAVVVNVGQAVNRRVALQIVADAGAYTGANVMAVGMNHVAYWNRQVQRMWGNVAQVSGGLLGLPWTFGGCISGWAAVGSYYGASGALAASIASFTATPRSWAERVTDVNARDLFPGEHWRITGSEMDLSMEVLMPPARPPFPLMFLPVRQGAEPSNDAHPWAIETPFDIVPVLIDGPSYRSGSVTWSCWVEGTIFPPVFSTVTFVRTPWVRLNRIPGLHPYRFAWIVRAPATRALMFDRFFGPNAIPEMKAAAVARPVGGHIERGRSEYRVKVEPVRTVNRTGLIYDSRYDRYVRPVVH